MSEVAWAVKVKSGGRWGWVGVDGFPIGWANRALHSKEGAAERLKTVMRQGATRARLVRITRRKDTGDAYSQGYWLGIHASDPEIRMRTFEEVDGLLQTMLDAVSESDAATTIGACREAIAALRSK